MNPAALRRLFGNSGQWRLTAVMLLLLAAVLLPDFKLSRRTFDYLVTFDITQSMNVEDAELDGQPVRRIALARAALRDVLRHLPCGSKVGWSVFSGYRSVVLLEPIEVCANYEVLLAALDRIGDQMRWANASSIGKGVYWAMRNAKDLAPARIVFLSDGQEAPAIVLDQSIAPPTEPGEVEGLLVGVGSATPSRVPKTNADGTISGYWTHEEVQQASGDAPGDGHEELSELRDQHLLDLARGNGLSYETLTSDTSLTPVLLQSRWGMRAVAPTNVRWVPALLALLLLIWHFLPGLPRRVRPLGRRRATAGGTARTSGSRIAGSVR